MAGIENMLPKIGFVSVADIMGSFLPSHNNAKIEEISE